MNQLTKIFLAEVCDTAKPKWSFCGLPPRKHLAEFNGKTHGRDFVVSTRRCSRRAESPRSPNRASGGEITWGTPPFLFFPPPRAEVGTAPRKTWIAGARQAGRRKRNFSSRRRRFDDRCSEGHAMCLGSTLSEQSANRNPSGGDIEKPGGRHARNQRHTDDGGDHDAQRRPPESRTWPGITKIRD